MTYGIAVVLSLPSQDPKPSLQAYVLFEFLAQLPVGTPPPFLEQWTVNYPPISIFLSSILSEFS